MIWNSGFQIMERAADVSANASTRVSFHSRSVLRVLYEPHNHFLTHPHTWRANSASKFAVYSSRNIERDFNIQTS